ncbi:MAG: VOC family protein [Pseudomonadota bacterium]
MMDQRITMVTLGVADLDRAGKFYAGLGWRKSSESQPGVTFYQLPGMVMGLFPLADLAKDQGRAGRPLGTGAVTLAHNLPDRAGVDALWAEALAAGATAVKAPEDVFWGGYSGYFADPDDHLWEIAHNPFWPLDAAGTVVLPGGTEP